MAFTADLTTDIGKVRLLLMDMDSSRPIFPDDAQIQTFLDLEGDVRNAAALAMESIAGNRVMVMQVVQLLDLKVDGLSVAKGLLLAAERLRATSDSDWDGFDVAEVTDNSDFAYRESLWKQLLTMEG